jgi:hypothetical protein
MTDVTTWMRLFVVGVLLVPVAAWAQAGEAKAAVAAAQPTSTPEIVERLLLGAPAGLRAGAGVIRWKPDYTYETLKKSTNRLVCFDRSEEDRRNPFAVQCTSEGSLGRVAQNRRFRAESKTVEEEEAKVKAAEAHGTRVKPEYGAPWINTNGPDAQHLRTHTTIAMPGATTGSTGLPDKAHPGGAWLMDAGTTGAHIMLPGQ